MRPTTRQGRDARSADNLADADVALADALALLPPLSDLPVSARSGLREARVALHQAKAAVGAAQADVAAREDRRLRPPLPGM